LAGKTGIYPKHPIIPMAGFFAGHVKTWFYRADTPDEDLRSTTKLADGSVSTSMKHTPTRTVDLAEAGRTAVAAGLPAVTFLSSDDVTSTVGRHLWPSKSAPGRASVGGDQLREVRVDWLQPCLRQDLTFSPNPSLNMSKSPSRALHTATTRSHAPH